MGSNILKLTLNFINLVRHGGQDVQRVMKSS